MLCRKTGRKAERMDKNLKPCPFCGEDPQIIRIKGKDGWRDRYTVRCPYDHDGCGAEGGMYHSEAEAVWAWNQRNEWHPLTKESRPPKGGEYLVDFQGMKVGICQYINGHFRNYGEIFDGMITRWGVPSAFGERRKGDGKCRWTEPGIRITGRR